MKSYPSIFLSVILSMSASPAFSYSGTEFLQHCNEATGAPAQGETPQQTVNRALQAGTCVGYVGGVINGLNLVGNMLRQQGGVKKNFICIGKKVQAPKLLKDLLGELEKQPQDMEAPVSLHIYRVFTERYPCADEVAEQKAE